MAAVITDGVIDKLVDEVATVNPDQVANVFAGKVVAVLTEKWLLYWLMELWMNLLMKWGITG